MASGSWKASQGFRHLDGKKRSTNITYRTGVERGSSWIFGGGEVKRRLSTAFPYYEYSIF